MEKPEPDTDGGTSLKDAMDAALGKRGTGSLLLKGVPGVGKTRALKELAEIFKQSPLNLPARTPGTVGPPIVIPIDLSGSMDSSDPSKIRDLLDKFNSKSGIILIDEIEKVSKEALDEMLKLLADPDAAAAIAAAQEMADAFRQGLPSAGTRMRPLLPRRGFYA